MDGYCPICGQACSSLMLDGAAWCPDDGRVMVNYERPAAPVRVLDVEGVEIRKGMIVMEDGLEAGLVTVIEGPDADYDDQAGRVVGRGPFVTVEYHDGLTERWTCDLSGHGPGFEDGPFVCGDVTVRP